MTGPYAGYLLVPAYLQYRGAAGAVVQEMRSTPATALLSSIVVLIGMWLERFVIIVSSLAQDFLPSSWRIFHATRWDWATYVGTIGLFRSCSSCLSGCCP
jgi:hypothetical protein